MKDAQDKKDPQEMTITEHYEDRFKRLFAEYWVLVEETKSKAIYDALQEIEKYSKLDKILELSALLETTTSYLIDKDKADMIHKLPEYNVSLQNLGLKIRLRSLLRATDLFTSGELMIYGEKALSGLYNLGPKSLKEIKTALQEQGLYLT